MSEYGSHSESDHPEVQWALDLLKPDPNHEMSVLQKYSSEITCMFSGAAITWAFNYRNRRPVLSGIPRYILSIMGGYVVAQGFNLLREDYQAKRDTRLREYIKAHPELFPEPARIKYKDLLQPWTPIR